VVAAGRFSARIMLRRLVRAAARSSSSSATRAWRVSLSDRSCAAAAASSVLAWVSSSSLATRFGLGDVVQPGSEREPELLLVLPAFGPQAGDPSAGASRIAGQALAGVATFCGRDQTRRRAPGPGVLLVPRLGAQVPWYARVVGGGDSNRCVEAGMWSPARWCCQYWMLPAVSAVIGRRLRRRCFLWLS